MARSEHEVQYLTIHGPPSCVREGRYRPGRPAQPAVYNRARWRTMLRNGQRAPVLGLVGDATA